MKWQQIWRTISTDLSNLDSVEIPWKSSTYTYNNLKHYIYSRTDWITQPFIVGLTNISTESATCFIKKKWSNTVFFQKSILVTCTIGVQHRIDDVTINEYAGSSKLSYFTWLEVQQNNFNLTTNLTHMTEASTISNPQSQSFLQKSVQKSISPGQNILAKKLIEIKGIAISSNY